jgi:hypothetical protein
VWFPSGESWGFGNRLAIDRGKYISGHNSGFRSNPIGNDVPEYPGFTVAIQKHRKRGI